ncbi:uncharacterized protein LOC107822907 [Nicotiana tabacum]|uniref:Random slug protein 5-like isoform X1 n=3 Tax=Nicotiana tabacum TaxID=4097 RepID=A0A1S4CUS7_TOBAC|nr:phosphatidylinositol transfer protein 3-like isoform X1 [Nicotiana tomentosiformis]XP_016504982.1 PREDICTED: random slug protein 5-like isoform X1 [Nicotiana tabacum]
MSSKKLHGAELCVSSAEQQAKINEVRKLIGPAVDKFPAMCSDASVLRFLRARNWHTKRAAKMLKETLIWRLEYKPEMIRWDDIAQQAETGKVYKANYFDKYGRTVLVMRPGIQNPHSVEKQMRYLVYCMENAILDLKSGQERMVWLIDFEGWNMSSISVKVTRETARVLQDRYPERLGLAIFYNPPKVFESFWILVKPFLEKRTYKKVRFVYPNDAHTQKVMEDLFHMDKLESSFGGKCTQGFEYVAYSKRMKEGDKKMSEFVKSGVPLPSDQYVTAETRESSARDNSFELSEDGLSSTDETTSNLESSDIETEDLQMSCKDEVKVDTTAAKEIKQSE